MAIYLAMTLGTFAVHPVDAARRDGMVEKIGDLSGLARTNPAMAFFLAHAAVLARRHSAARRLLREILRVPRARSRPASIALAVIGVLASVVGAYYYLLIVKIMYFDEPAQGLRCRCRAS